MKRLLHWNLAPAYQKRKYRFKEGFLNKSLKIRPFPPSGPNPAPKVYNWAKTLILTPFRRGPRLWEFDCR